MRSFKFWILYTLSAIFLLATTICLVMLFFSGQMAWRERHAPQAVAPTNGGFVETRDALVHVAEAGAERNPHVILVGGAASWGNLWWETMEPLANADFHALGIDLPPFGFSQRLPGAANYKTERQALRIIDALKSMQVEKAVFVCHSIGCRPVLAALMVRPALASKLVMISPALGFASDKKTPHYQPPNPSSALRTFLSMSFIRTAGLASFVTNAAALPWLFKAYTYNDAAISAGRGDILSNQMQVADSTVAFGDWLTAAATLPETSPIADFQAFRRLNLPVLLVYGRQDDTTPVWEGEALQKLFPRAVLKVFDDCGHIPYLERQDDFNTLLLHFVKGEPLEE